MQCAKGAAPRRTALLRAAAAWSRHQYYNPAFATRRNGGAVRMHDMRPQLCAVQPRPPRLLQAVQGQGRQVCRQCDPCKMQGVRQGVHCGQPQTTVLLGRVPTRGQAAARPRVPPAGAGRPTESRHSRGARKGLDRPPQGQGGGRRRRWRAAPAGGPRRRRPHIERRTVKVDSMRSVRPQLCTIRPRLPRLLQPMQGQGRQVDRQGAQRKVRRVRQGVRRSQPHVTILLARVPHRSHPPNQPRAVQQAHGRPRGARQDSGAQQGTTGRQKGHEEVSLCAWPAARRAAHVRAKGRPALDPAHDGPIPCKCKACAESDPIDRRHCAGRGRSCSARHAARRPGAVRIATGRFPRKRHRGSKNRTKASHALQCRKRPQTQIPARGKAGADPRNKS